MKKTTLYFSLATALTACLFLFPSLTGSIMLDANEKPKGFLSKLWAGNRTEFMTHSYPNNIRVVKIEGSSNPVNVDILEGEKKLFSPTPNSHKLRFSKDTLIIKTNNAAYLQLYTSSNLTKIIFEHATGQLSIKDTKTPLEVELMQSSTIRLNFPSLTVDDSTAIIRDLNLFVSEKSVATLVSGKAKNIAACVNNAELNYSNAVAVDSANVQLAGRSIVKSLAFDSEHKLNNLIVSGHKQYFKPELIGNNVQLQIK